MVLREPALLDMAAELKAEEFSVPLFSKVYAQLQQRHQMHQEISLAVLTEVDADEMSHLAGMLYQQNMVNEDAFRDCIRTIKDEYRSAKVETDDDLLAFQKRMQQRKGT